MAHSAELVAALEAADLAARIARSRYRTALEVRLKPDGSPVTQADVECESAIRELLEARFPGHGFYGEETGARDLDAESVWVVDPIDGTKAFVRGYSMFSTQIGLLRAGVPVLGVSSAPLYGELAYGERGRGARVGTTPARVSTVSTVEGAVLSVGNMSSLATGPRWIKYGQLAARVSRARGYGDFLHYHLLASGHLDVVIETDINILDIGACAAIVIEAGGCFTDLEGAPLGLGATSVLAAATPALHAAVLRALN
jgi:histidinol-phosphatase